MSLELRTLPIDHLKPAAYNPRKTLRPESPAYRKLKASIAVTPCEAMIASMLSNGFFF